MGFHWCVKRLATKEIRGHLKAERRWFMKGVNIGKVKETVKNNNYLSPGVY